MPGTKKLDISFYNRRNVVQIARELLGKILVTEFDGKRTSGRIVETEAYEGENDRASHAFGGRRTTRTGVMYGAPGTIYIYIIYGLHYLFNIITNKKDVPHAILIRAVEPLEGIDIMIKRTGKLNGDFTITKGPGNLTRALGISKKDTGGNVFSRDIFLEDDGFRYKKDEILPTKRIGVEYAREDAELPYRFIVKGNPYVSAKKS